MNKSKSMFRNFKKVLRISKFRYTNVPGISMDYFSLFKYSLNNNSYKNIIFKDLIIIINSAIYI